MEFKPLLQNKRLVACGACACAHIGGGGGGGGIGISTGGSGGLTAPQMGNSPAQAGASGILTSAGSKGLSWAGQYGPSAGWTAGMMGVVNDGGNGGGAGSAGDVGKNGYNYYRGNTANTSAAGTGGAGGAAVAGNSYVTWLATGTRNGAIA